MNYGFHTLSARKSISRQFDFYIVAKEENEAQSTFYLPRSHANLYIMLCYAIYVSFYSFGL